MINIQKSIIINADLARCFTLLTNFGDYPCFLDNVLCVRCKNLDNIWHWQVRDEEGALYEWDMVIEQIIPTALLSWNSIGPASIEIAGDLHFIELSKHATRLDLNAAYFQPSDNEQNGEFDEVLAHSPLLVTENAIAKFKAYAEQHYRRTSAHQYIKAVASAD